MKIKIPKIIEEDIARLRIDAAVNYGDEEIPENFPGRRGDSWTAVIDIDTGKIEGWPQGRAEKMHLTVKDCGSYILFNRAGFVVAERLNNYVPHGVVPGKYGDVIELDIAEDGTVKNWTRNINLRGFFDNGEDA